MPSETSQEIRSFIVATFLFGDVATILPEDASFIERGVVDSTGILELVSFVEETFGVIVSDAEILPANFDSIARVAEFIARKRATVQAA